MRTQSNSNISSFYIFVFAWFIISLRFVLEVYVANISNCYFLYFHHQFWFYAVFLLYMTILRYILKIGVNKILLFPLVTPILLLPIFINFFLEEKAMSINYIAPDNIYHYLYHIITFMFFHSHNHTISFELLFLFIGLATLSYLITHNIFKSFIFAILAYILPTILYGTLIIAPEAFSKSIFIFSSHIDQHAIIASIFLIMMFVTLFVLFWFEIQKFLLNYILNYTTLMISISIFLLFYTFFIVFPPIRYNQTPTFADMIVLSIHPFIYSILFIALRGKFLSVKLFLLVMTGMSLALVIALFTPFNMKKIEFDRQKYDVVIIGGGLTGLEAAHYLNGVKTLLLEKNDELGDQIETKIQQGIPYDLGKVFLNDITLLPFDITKLSIMREKGLLGFFRQNKLWLAPNIFYSIKNYPPAYKDIPILQQIKKGNPQKYALLNKDTQIILESFLNINKKEKYPIKTTFSAFTIFNTYTPINGVRQILNTYKSHITGEIITKATVVSINDKGAYVEITYQKNNKLVVIESKTVIITTPNNISHNIITKQSVSFKKLLSSITYIPEIRIVVAFTTERPPPFRYLSIPEYPFNAIYQAQTAHTNIKLFYIHYFGKKAEQFKNTNNKEIILATTTALIRMNLLRNEDIVFTDIKRWAKLNTIINVKEYNLSSTSKPSKRVFLTGEYIITSNHTTQPYDFSSTIINGRKAAKEVQKFLISTNQYNKKPSESIEINTNIIKNNSHAATVIHSIKPTKESIEIALDNAIDFLYKSQLKYGEFKTYACKDLELTKCIIDSSPFSTTFVMYSLQNIKNKKIKPMINKSVDFLLSEEEPNGIWRYWTKRNSNWIIKNSKKVPPDLDDIATISFALKSNQIKFGNNINLIKQNRNHKGIFLTGVNIPNSDFDCLVNTNILLYLGDHYPNVCKYINNAIKNNEQCSIYYPDQLSLFYMVSRAFVNNVPCLGKNKKIILNRILSMVQSNGSFGNHLQTALALNTLYNYNYNGPEIKNAISFLINSQKENGSWSRELFFQGIPPQTPPLQVFYFGSEELTTAFVLEALNRYQ